MTQTINQIKEEIMEDIHHIALALELPAQVYDDYTFWLSTALDKVIKATADAMVGDRKDQENKSGTECGSCGSSHPTICDCQGYNTRIAEEKALRDEITQ